ncbi:BMP family ABC transporter substrate-binding protein [Agromyces badenianii]|uniref:BMP family ABC transporter substrate-binding protein n=1 Tax=Agromyces badenianii TaxID=2080742 RepID=A0A2S0WXB9_9MICO|nr:BMP family ABC transporter substrate-binding protein [Agromyces badenianii]AWB95948.1 BMP family ABC transporter substrate-binding protein [Agromyces badenianii]PWC04812.1 BMP family ABC transporter substrate-binding protein [Agromyces badenianii]
MKVTTKKAALGGLALFGAAVLLAGCASAPEESGDGGGEAIDFQPCMVSDSGGFDDKSFNQLGFEGATKAADELGVELIDVQSDSETDYAPNLTNLVDQGCDLIVTVGFALSAATVESALENPDVEYVIIDDAADNDFDGEIDAPNIKPILFDTAQAAFLGGYAAADYTKTNTVGTFGGMNFPTVSIFMDGFKQGVDYYNEEKGKGVTVLGWDGTDGLFTGGFEANDTARQTAQGLLDQNVDVLLPVGGPIYQSAAAAIRDSGADVALMGVDADFTETDPSVADLVLTSILKGIDVGTYEAVLAAGNGDFDPTAFIGTLENEGVGLAPFHDFESKVSSTLQSELDDLKAAIIAGDVTVESYLAG